MNAYREPVVNGPLVIFGMVAAVIALLMVLAAVRDHQEHSACKDAPLATGCTHPDQRYTVVDGAKMCLCTRDGGAK